MADAGGRGQISLVGVSLVSVGSLLIWSAVNNPPNGPMGALKEFLTTGAAQVGTVDQADDTSIRTTSAVANASGNGARVVAVARQYLGDPYVWAGESHKGVDCSGLVLVAYRDGAGIKLPHFATAQAAKGRRVSADQVVAGDLVCWGVPGNFPHIALAVNQETCIAAWTYGVGVKEDKIHQKAVPGFGYPYFYRIL